MIGPASNGVVRLYRNGVTSSSYYYGIVQIWYNGQWGNICDDDDYNQYEADVICHQLGYIGASSYSRAELTKYTILFYFLNQYTDFLSVLGLIIMKCFWIIWTVLTGTISQFYSVLILHILIMDVLIIMMLLCTAVSFSAMVIYYW